MTLAAWVASIEAVGVLTVELSATHVAQAIQDGDAALGAALLSGGSRMSSIQVDGRVEMLALFSFFQSAAQASPGRLLSATARTALVAAGTSYYTVTGAP